MIYANVISSGNSAVVTLPKRWREINGINPGDKVSIGFPTSSMMTIEPIKVEAKDKAKTFEVFRDQVERDLSGPDVPKTPVTREEVRAMLSDRYA